MSEEVVLFLIGQAVVIVIAGLGFFWGISSKIGGLRADVTHYAEQRREALTAHLELARRVDGISRAVERHDTIIDLREEIIARASR